jgi:hypothetical protein
MKLKTSLFLLLCTPFFLQAKPFFQNAIIAQLDCIRIGTAVTGIEGKTIHDCLWLINQMNVMQQGERVKESTVKDERIKEATVIRKLYRINNTPCTLTDLVELERELQKERASLSAAHKPKDLEESQEKLHELNERLSMIDTTLGTVQQDFVKKTACFMPQIRILKSLILELIREWSERTKRQQSFLLRWASIDNEEEAIKEMKSAAEFNDFVNDLKDFLKKLMQSCPKALEDYKIRFGSEKA